MRIVSLGLLIFAMLLTSAFAYADGWASYNSSDRIGLEYADDGVTQSQACQNARSQAYSYISSHDIDFPYTLVNKTGFTTGPYPHSFYCSYYLVEWVGSGQPNVDSAPGDVVYNAAYTDEQCQSQYGGYGRQYVDAGIGTDGTGTIDAGACSISLAQNDKLQCSHTDDGHPRGGFCYGDIEATSTGEANDPDAAFAPPEQSPDDELPEYLEPTDDPASCSGGSVGYGGQSYCYTGGAGSGGGSDDGGDSTGGGSDDGGSDGGSSGGDSGSDDGSDGGSSGGGSNGGDSGGSSGGGAGGSGGGSGGAGDGAGDTGDDDGLGLGDVIDAINGGFNGLVDKIAGVTDTVDGVKNAVDEGNQAAEDRFNAITDSAPTESDLEAQFGSADEHQGLMEEALDGTSDTLTDYIDGTDSTFSNLVEGMKDLARSAIPQIPSPSCQPLVFAPGKVYSLTIDCEVFELIRSSLAWILYVLTAWSMLSTMFASRPH